MIGRRSTLQGIAAAGLAQASGLARPALAAGNKTLTIVPQATLNSVDPIWSTSQISRNLGFMVFEPLYGRDADLVPRPLMVEADEVEDGARRWTMRLRPDLLFHDGEKVRAQDCVASLGRWMKRDAAGMTLATRLDALEAKDDRTIVWRLSKPFPHLRALLSKVVQPALMMPERLARTDPFKQITEVIGSGPFRWLADEHVLASHAGFARFDRYVPRDEKPSYMAGGHRVLLDRVEWKMIPDAGTAANALMTGEIDWIEIPLPDLLAMLRKASGVKTGVLDKSGQIMMVRPNHLIAPTNLMAVRQFMQAAISQAEVVSAVMGADPANGTAGVGFLATGNPDIDGAGLEVVRKRHTRDELKAMLEKSGYAGEKLVLLHATDHIFFNPMGSVIANLLTDAGMAVDDQAMDWPTVQTRRVSKEPLGKGGWSMFPSLVAVTEYRDLLLTSFMRGNGRDGWFGWPNDPRMDEIFDLWLATSDPAEQTKLEREYELEGLRMLPFIPLGRFRQTAAWRANLTGLLEGPSVVFWNVTKT
jgi:peptide/nickel transport system substrate-binding protein